jgi:hypothetical protein
MKIWTKYQGLGYSSIVVVAPEFCIDTPLSLAIKAIAFIPDATPLREAYITGELPGQFPPEILRELSVGGHHFRYSSLNRAKGESATYRNQVDKSISTIPQLFRDIRRLTIKNTPPARVFWSVSRWLFPKDLFNASQRNHLLSRGLVFDIDGNHIHVAEKPCEILPGEVTCRACLVAAKDATLSLLDFLKNAGLTNLSVVFSGRRGFHVYVLGETLAEHHVQKLVKSIENAAIPIDSRHALDPKAVVTFPGSIHGFTMRRAVPISNLETFSIFSVL